MEQDMAYSITHVVVNTMVLVWWIFMFDLRYRVTYMFYLITSVEVSGKGGVGKCTISQHPMALISMGHIEKSHNSQLGNWQGFKSHSACDLMVPGPRQLPHWKYYVISQWAWVPAITMDRS